MAVQTATVPITRRRFTIDEYYRLAEVGILTEDDRVELIEGEIVEMNPIGSRHAECVRRLNGLLNQVVGDAAIVDVQNPVRLGPTTELEPDLMLLHDRSYAASHPIPEDVLLLIEVSDTTLAYDRDVKLPLYAKAGIPTVLLFDLPHDTLLRYTQPTADGYRVIERFLRGDRITLSPLPSLTITIDLEDLFEQLT